jgi:hypothetical protein
VARISRRRNTSYIQRSMRHNMYYICECTTIHDSDATSNTTTGGQTRRLIDVSRLYFKRYSIYKLIVARSPHNVDSFFNLLRDDAFSGAPSVIPRFKLDWSVRLSHGDAIGYVYKCVCVCVCVYVWVYTHTHATRPLLR